MGYLFSFLFCLASLGGGGFWLYKRIQFRKHSITAEAEVIEVIMSGDDHKYLVFKFFDTKNQSHIVKSRFRNSWYEKYLGRRITIRYLEENPQSARMDRFSMMFLYPSIITAIGCNAGFRFLTNVLNSSKMDSSSGNSQSIPLPFEFQFDIFDFSPIVFVLICYFIWVRFGKNNTFEIKDKYYPPENISPVEASFIMQADQSNNFTLSLLISLANKGYIVFRDDYDLWIEKVNDYNGTDPYERVFMNNLFNCGNKLNRKELKYSLGSAIYEIIMETRKQGMKHKYFEKGSVIWRFVVFILLSISLLITVLNPRINTGIIEYFFVSIIMNLGFVPVLEYITLKERKTSTKWVTGIFTVILSYLSIIPLTPALEVNLYHIFPLTLGIVCGWIMLGFMVYMKKRNKLGDELYQKIEGILHFFENSDIQTLRSVVTSERNYLMDILPIIYAVDLQERWIEVYQKIGLTDTPNWYIGNNAFDPKRFLVDIMENMIKTE